MDDNVYLGVWTNWSHGKVMGATLTTTRQQGNLIIAFTGFLVPVVASRFWSILCLIFHQCYSTSEPRDALYHQRQVILRNSSSPDSGLLSLLYLCWAWRNSPRLRHSAKTTEKTKNSTHIFPTILFATCCISAFTIAGGFSSRISSAPGDVVLINSGHCGILDQASYSLNATNTKPFSTGSKRINDAANYAEQCYSNSSGVLDCDKFVVKNLRLPTSTIKNDSCPFQDSICRSNDSNLSLDTGYINSNDDLGLNAPEDQRFEWRYVLKCAPLVTEGYTTQVTLGNQTMVRFNYGSLTMSNNELSNSTKYNFTYEIEDLNYQYFDHRGRQVSLDGYNYKLNNEASVTFQGAPSYNESEFIPIPSLVRSDGDTTVVFISGNGVSFIESMDDDWYRATTPWINISRSNVITSGTTQTYMPAEAASPLGCLEQWQWCNSAFPRESGCGPLAGMLDAIYGATPLFNLTTADLRIDRPTAAAGTQFIWDVLMKTAGSFYLNHVLHHLGAKSLSSQSLLQSGVQFPIPRNQWQLDVTNWWNIVLASVQATYVNTALGTTDPQLLEYTWVPLNAEERKLCDSQKIRSTAYASFSLFGLLFTYITSSLIIIISFSLQPILVCLYKRRKYKEYAFLEWTTNANLQLHRLAQEELQIGTWSRCTNIVPITETGDLLANLDIKDLEHPILALPVNTADQESKPEVTNQEGELHEGTSASDSLHPITQSSTDVPVSDEEVQHCLDPLNDTGETFEPSTNAEAPEQRGALDQEHESDRQKAR